MNLSNDEKYTYRLNDVWRCPHYLEPEGEARGVPNSVDTSKHRLTDLN